MITTKMGYESVIDLLGLPAYLALLVGIFMLILGFLGVIGALREHLNLLRFVSRMFRLITV